jgi:hypothetical protein
LLDNIIGGLSGVSTSPTAAQSGAASDLLTAAKGIPNLAPQLTGVTTGALSGDPTGLLHSGYQNLNSNIGDIASSNPDPMSNPAIRGYLDTVRQDVQNATDGQFAAAGRDLSPANSYATARGIAAAEAPILTQQYNTNVGNKMAAAGTLYNAGNTTAGNITNTQQTGLSDAAALPGLLTQPAQTELNAATTQAQLPLSTIQQLEALGLPIASTFGTSTSTGTGTSSTTQQLDPTAQILGGLLGAAGLAGKFMSDIRLKENIEPVGMLNDGLPIYRWNYIGDDQTHIGPMAQDVERIHPEAVSEIGGFKAIDVDRATDRAAQIGGLLDMAA